MQSFLADLVRLPSVNGVHTEESVAQRIAQEATRLGLDHRICAKDPRRPNVVVTVGRGPCRFLFVAHMDTVGVGDHSKWSSPPFGAKVVDGKLIGRGACDNKAGIAVAVYTLAELKDDILKGSQGSVKFAAVVDEESGASSELGVKYLLQEDFIGGAECCGSIYTYHGRTVTIGHRGLLRLWINVGGVPVHAGSSQWALKEKGANSIMLLVKILNTIDMLDWEQKEVEGFKRCPLTVTPGTLIEGGEGESIIPEKARALVDIRIPPDHDHGAILERIKETVSDVVDAHNGSHSDKVSADVVVKNRIPSYYLSPDHKLAQVCALEIEKITGVRPELRGCGPANEGYMLGNAGIPCIPGMGPIGGNAHAIDEFVVCDSLCETVKIYSGIVKEMMGLNS